LPRLAAAQFKQLLALKPCSAVATGVLKPNRGFTGVLTPLPRLAAAQFKQLLALKPCSAVAGAVGGPLR
jgi:hypothetical protein